MSISSQLAELLAQAGAAGIQFWPSADGKFLMASPRSMLTPEWCRKIKAKEPSGNNLYIFGPRSRYVLNGH